MNITKLVSVFSVLTIVGLGSFAGCTATVDDSDDDGGGSCDRDRDGHNDTDCDNGSSGSDCDDLNNMVFPGAQEVCNGRDDNCSGSADEGNVCNGNPPPSDMDGDGDPDSSDCFPNDPNRHHGCPETCGNGQDDNCNDVVDEGCSTGNCGSCDGGNGGNGGNGGSGGSGGSSGNGTLPSTTRTVYCEWDLAQSIQPTGPAFIAGQYPKDGGGYVAHWTPNGDCTPASAEERFTMLDKNGSIWSGDFQVHPARYLTFVAGGVQSTTDTGCMWSFDQGFWQGGGSGANNGIMRCQIDGGPWQTVANGGIVQTPNNSNGTPTFNGRLYVP